MKNAEALETKRKWMNFITSNISLKCGVNWPSVSWWWISEHQQEGRMRGRDWLYGVMMKQTKVEIQLWLHIWWRKNTSDIKVGPCSNRSSSDPDTAGLSASAGAHFIGEACKKKKKNHQQHNDFKSVCSTRHFFHSLRMVSRAHRRSNSSVLVS